MLDAICKIDHQPDIIYSVFKFQVLSDAEIEGLRQHLFCPVCDGKAYFRKASKDGKAACFGSRYHQPDCAEFKPSASRQREEQDATEVNQLITDSDALKIDFSRSPSTAKAKPFSPQTAVLDKKAQSNDALELLNQVAEPQSQYLDDKTAHQPEQRIGSQGLEKLLNSLLRGSDLASSDLWVYTDEKYRWRAKNLFVNFVDAEPTNNGSPRMYWGTLSHSDKAMLWLNPADSKDVGIPIDSFKGALQQRFGIEDRRDLEGAGIIIFGKCFWNKDKTRKIIQLWNRDVTRMHLSKADD
ncbi:hypothetical protein TUM4644_01530 [Shewanella colwelliana]|uniref:hypothetical protein n=1 Tax=Shewanella colwelliana TaxID=23 RepID=UPI001BC5E253|nr:hypothetical protein [Shewanella colwelliana]GIU16897.1 hypothetical protein TUM4644_01530 [Shewanella colwelliana]